MRDQFIMKREALFSIDDQIGKRMRIEDDRIGTRDDELDRRDVFLLRKCASLKVDLRDRREIDDQSRMFAHFDAGKRIAMKRTTVEELDDDPQRGVRTKFQSMKRVFGDVQPRIWCSEGQRQRSIRFLDNQRLKCIRLEEKFQLTVEDHIRIARAEIEVSKCSCRYIG